eukprot:CAMPEP_0197259100 /NCGR_PEP_ID=MMETSP1429-20130617/83345_1 /TAXON_ID=49237 /ORGANISM="Chaetoceros  sp., Strain UNC1202" /LENGTH=353 /DNA_ID=CAMNT_0042723299 /DNA_START=32 /DNA_END=1093 /DNA_ORIENTATION=-
MTSRPFMDVSNVDLHDPPLKKYDGVVIATKVLWSKDRHILKEMFCLLNAAYNRHVHYDLLVFTTEPWTEEEIHELAHVVSPAKLTVVVEGPSLEDHVASMDEQEIKFLYERCNVKADEKITWFHHCKEKDSHLVNNLGYAWQSEFRAYHIWNHDALKNYQYMMWIDSDAMCTQHWETDPIQMFIENELNLMFDHFPGGFTRNEILKEKMMSAYGKSLCKVSMTEMGLLEPTWCREQDLKPSVRQVYGFNHITRLDVYRSEKHQKFLKTLVSDYRFSRRWDDQLAVTVPAVMEDPEKAWDMRKHGIHLGLHHNTMIDGKEKGTHLSYVKWWTHTGKKKWAVGRAMCDGLIIELK